MRLSTETGNGTTIAVVQGVATVSNSTFSGDDEAELHMSSSGTLDLDHVTVAGEFQVNTATSSWHNVVLSGECVLNTGGSISSNGGNAESPGDTCGLDPITDLTSIDPPQLALGPLADNGGRTPIRALHWSSVAVGFGVADCLPTDQRLVPRAAAECTSGAFESPFFTDGFESGDTSAWSLTMP